MQANFKETVQEKRFLYLKVKGVKNIRFVLLSVKIRMDIYTILNI